MKKENCKKAKKESDEKLHFMHTHVFLALLKFMRFRSYLNSDLFELSKIVQCKFPGHKN